VRYSQVTVPANPPRIRPESACLGVSGAGAVPYNRPNVVREPFTEARLLTVNEVADLLRVSRMTVYRLIKQGEMPALRVGRGYRLRDEDVQSYLIERYTEAG
jgi:excisionase family DNA binding protein